MTSKYFQEPLIKSNEQFIRFIPNHASRLSNFYFSQNSDRRIFKSDPPGKDARRIFNGKGVVMGEWKGGGDVLSPLIFFTFKYDNEQDELISNTCLKVVQAIQIRSNGHFKFKIQEN